MRAARDYFAKSARRDPICQQRQEGLYTVRDLVADLLPSTGRKHNRLLLGVGVVAAADEVLTSAAWIGVALADPAVEVSCQRDWRLQSSYKKFNCLAGDATLCRRELRPPCTIPTRAIVIDEAALNLRPGARRAS
jgi:hypothetical protein